MNGTIMDERIEKLPKWARFRIAKLEADNSSLKRRIHEMDSGESNIWFGNPLDQIHIPSGSTVTFQLKEGKISFRIYDEDEPEVYMSTDATKLIFRPAASNAMFFSVEERLFRGTNNEDSMD